MPMPAHEIRTALVAEDEAIIRLDIVETLREAGFDVVAEAGDGAMAVELARQHRPDVIVMDIKMPNMDGIEAAEQIRELKIPVVLLTAFSQKELVERAAEAGAMAYVVKPFSPSDLLPAVEVALSRHAQLIALEHEITDLQERLETRKLIDQAKGLLIAKNLVKDEPDAFRWIQKSSMDRRLSMSQVARTVIEQLTEKPEPTK
jgi:response regulator NasT